MKIAHVATTSVPVIHDKGGAVQRRILGIAREQARQGHEVIIYSPGQVGPIRECDVRVVPVPLRSRRPYRDYEYLFKVRGMMKREDSEVVHSHGLPDAARILGNRSARAFFITVDYFKYRLAEGRPGRAYYRQSLEMYDQIFPVSMFCAAEMSEYYKISRTRLQVVYNGVDLNQFFPDDAEAGRVALKYRLGNPYLLYLGRINYQKGSDLLPGLANALERVAVVAAGPLGQFGTNTDPSVGNPLASSSVRHLGAVPEEDLRGLLSGAQALLLPTRHDEMFGMVLVEAGACGTPAIASDLGGIPEALGNGGILFKAGSPKDLERAVKEFLNNSEGREMLSAKAHENSKRFAWEKIAREYTMHYV